MPNLFHERKKKLEKLRDSRTAKVPVSDIPVYERCPSCGADNTRETLRRSMYVCPRCEHHFTMPARERLVRLFDQGTFRERFANVQSNATDFPGYAEKLADLRRRTGKNEACVCATGRVNGRKIVAAAQDTDFMMGSMGVAVGEMVAQSAEYARASKLPLVIFCAGGGARMQEGIFSLMQMAKTSAAIRKLSDAGGLYVAVITHPTTGGITASYASLGDVTLAEPGALFGFAGPRVIEQTIGETLPEGFQRSEFQLEHGFVDAVVQRAEMRETISRLLKLYERRR